MLEPAAGKLISGRYRLEHQVGEGGMGSVWVAEDEKLERWVAVKLLGERYASSRSARQRFEREAMAIAKLRSPNVVQVFDYGTDDGQAFMVMELLNGQDLFTWLAAHRGVPLAKIVRIVVQVARALSAAHRAGIVHRDLKPANIFVVKDHEEDCVKVFDFGLAKGLSELSPLRELKDQTGEGVLLGTPRYMSPEQAHGAKRVDHRSDLWSLGVIAYLAVTGKLPFDGKGVGEIITKIATEKHTPPSALIDSLPSSVDVFFERALAKEPGARFQTAAELADAFEELAGSNVSMELVPLIDPDTLADLEALNEADTELGDVVRESLDSREPPAPLTGDDTELDTPSPLAAPELPVAPTPRRIWAPLAVISGAIVLAGVVAAQRAPAQFVTPGVAPLVVQPTVQSPALDPREDSAPREPPAPTQPDASTSPAGHARVPSGASDPQPGEPGNEPLEDDGSDDGEPADGSGGARGLDLFGDRH